MTELEERLGHAFRDGALLRTALTHSSYANVNRAAESCNERLEFLGDSILGLTVAEHLYRRFPRMPEGRMTRLRAELVCEQSLYRVAQSLGLGEHLRLGRGEEHSGGRDRPSILSDAVEALIAAIYLDAGMDKAAVFVRRCLLEGLDAGERGEGVDSKTALQELVQERQGQPPVYRMVGEEGPDHAKTFTVEVLIDGRVAGRGSGRSKKEAERAAAESVLEGLRL